MSIRITFIILLLFLTFATINAENSAVAPKFDEFRIGYKITPYTQKRNTVNGNDEVEISTLTHSLILSFLVEEKFSIYRGLDLQLDFTSYKIDNITNEYSQFSVNALYETSRVFDPLYSGLFDLSPLYSGGSGVRFEYATMTHSTFEIFKSPFLDYVEEDTGGAPDEKLSEFAGFLILNIGGGVLFDINTLISARSTLSIDGSVGYRGAPARDIDESASYSYGFNFINEAIFKFEQLNLRAGIGVSKDYYRSFLKYYSYSSPLHFSFLISVDFKFSPMIFEI